MTESNLTREEFSRQVAEKLSELMAASSEDRIEGLDDLTGGEVFSGLLISLYTVYRMTTGSEADLLEFTHVLNRLAVNLAVESMQTPTDDGEADTPVQ